MTICAVTNHDVREDMLQYADTNLNRLQGGNLKEHPNTNLRKLGWAAWRYQRGSRSLTINRNLGLVNIIF